MLATRSTLSFFSGVPNKSRAVRCLIPRSSVPCSAALRLLGGMKRFSLSLQHLVLRWIVLVFDTIDDATPLHAVYSIIMYYIQVDDLVRTSGTLLDDIKTLTSTSTDFVAKFCGSKKGGGGGGGGKI